ncbi:hypothetical protein E1B28_006054 [Marasmius oreades]|nr:uncharacterized protein E1B28_006054 [Marasmius oreades]KAG7095283.1 hypothetical protein E1B28_006054 [Marasmius oreades]
MSLFSVCCAAKSYCRAQQRQMLKQFYSSTAVWNEGLTARRHRKSNKLSSLQPTQFVREEVPHNDMKDGLPEQGRATGFRRRSGPSNRRDWMRRSGRWGDELENTNADSSLIQQVKSKISETGEVYSNRSAEALSRSSQTYKKYDSSQTKDLNSSLEASPNNEPSSSPNTYLPPIKAFFEPPPDLAGRQTASVKLEHKTIPETSVYTKFTSPPLLQGLHSCLLDLIGPHATPTQIQALSMKQILPHSDRSSLKYPGSEPQWKQWLLASETGSGKSIAYLLPLLQSLKLTELNASSSRTRANDKKEVNPRALILAPTHELARQLSMFAKALQHEIKMRIMCASRANTASSGQEKFSRSHARERGLRASEMSSMDLSGSDSGEFELSRNYHPVDVLVGTPMKLLEMVRGRGWEKDEDGPGLAPASDEVEDENRKLRRGRDKIPGVSNKAKNEGFIGLEHIEWVIVDEADVLFDPDFQETTRMLLSDISVARSSSSSFNNISSSDCSASTTHPFNLIFTSATIPTSLHNYIAQNHPDMQRLVSPGVHKLPKDLKVEYVDWTGGNRMADIEKRIRQVWAEDSSTIPKGNLSQVLIFCNKSNKVQVLGEYLESKKIKTVSVTSTSGTRARGSNRHLSGFLKTLPGKGPEVEQIEKREIIWDNEEADQHQTASSTSSGPAVSGPRVLKPTTTSVGYPPMPLSQFKEQTPRVMITTSLLSRGLDFSPTIKHVFIVDEPRNVLDFLHRAGRSGRAGHKGRVVVFGKFPDSGRGAGRSREVKKRVGELISRRR